MRYKPLTMNAYLDWLSRKVFKDACSEGYRLGWVGRDFENDNILDVEILNVEKGEKKLYATLAIIFSAEKSHCLQEIIVKKQQCTIQGLEDAMKELVVPVGQAPVRNP